MKLVIISAIDSFKKDIIALLKKNKIGSFSYKEVTGYKDISDLDIESNWFANELNQTPSLLFYAFAKNETIQPLMESITAFNEEQETHSHIHVGLLALEQFNNPTI